MIYHITTKTEWEKAQQDGFYKAASLDTEGFIHMCSAEQVEGVLERYFSNQQDLVKLHINEALLSSPLKYELAPSVNDTFPHVYGTVNLDAVVNTSPI